MTGLPTTEELGEVARAVAAGVTTRTGYPATAQAAVVAVIPPPAFGMEVAVDYTAGPLAGRLVGRVAIDRAYWLTLAPALRRPLLDQLATRITDGLARAIGGQLSEK